MSKLKLGKLVSVQCSVPCLVYVRLCGLSHVANNADVYDEFFLPHVSIT